MIVNLTKHKIEGVEPMPQEIIDKITKYREAIDYVYELDNSHENIPYMTTKEVIAHMYIAINNIARLLEREGYKHVFIGRFRTAFCVSLERKLNDLKIEASYVFI